MPRSSQVPAGGGKGVTHPLRCCFVPHLARGLRKSSSFKSSSAWYRARTDPITRHRGSAEGLQQPPLPHGGRETR